MRLTSCEQLPGAQRNEKQEEAHGEEKKEVHVERIEFALGRANYEGYQCRSRREYADEAHVCEVFFREELDYEGAEPLDIECSADADAI